MNTSLPFLVALKRACPPDTWAPMLAAWRQDDLLWQRLASSDLGWRALEILPFHPAYWSPAALALLALGEPELAASLDDLAAISPPAVSLDGELSSRAAQSYTDWLDNPGSQPMPLTTLEQAGLLALALSHKRRQKSSWKGVLPVEILSCTGSGPVDSSPPAVREGRGVRSSLACLYGMVSDGFDLLRTILLEGEAAGRSDLTLHILLSNPMPGEALRGILRTLLDELPPWQSIDLLHSLARRMPWLPAGLGYMASTGESGQYFPVGPAPDGFSPVVHMADLNDRLHRAQGCRLAGEAEQSTELLQQGIEISCRLQASLFAALGYGLAQVHQGQVQAGEQVCQAWRQAVQLDDTVPEHRAGLALALLENGQPAEALVCGSQIAAPLPAARLATALAAKHLKHDADASQAAQQTLLLLEAGGRLDPMGCLALGQLFQSNEQFDQAERALQAGLEHYPLDEALLLMMAQVQLRLVRPERAYASAAAALAVECLASRRHAVQAEIGSRAARLLVESAQQAGEWATAFDEWNDFLESAPVLVEFPAGMDNQPEFAAQAAADLRAFAGCALRAGQPGAAQRACQQVLAYDERDGLSHELLARAAGALHDLPAVIEHTYQAVQLLPQRADLWLDLAHLHFQAGRTAQGLQVLQLASQALPTSFEVAFALGQVYRQQRAFSQALPWLKQAVELAPEAGMENLQAAWAFGDVLFELGRVDEARQVLQTAHRSADQLPAPVELLTGLARSYALALLSGAETAQQHQAIPLLEQVLAAHPQDYPICLALAGALLAQAEPEDIRRRAIPLLREVASKREGDMAAGISLSLQAQIMLAEAYSALDDLPGALQAYKRARQWPLLPGSEFYERLVLGLAHTALALGQVQAGMAVLSEAAQSLPQYLVFQHELAWACLAAGEMPRCFHAARAGLALHPLDQENLAWFVDVLWQLRISWGEAPSAVQNELLDALRQLVRLAPQSGTDWMRLGSLLLETQDILGAVQVFEKLAGLADLCEVAVNDLFTAAGQMHHIGEIQLAIDLLKQAERLTINSGQTVMNCTPVDVLVEMAALYRLLGDPQAALQVVERALGLQPGNIALWESQLDLLESLKRPDAVQACLVEALRLAPDHPALCLHMSRFLSQKGELASALQYASHALELLQAGVYQADPNLAVRPMDLQKASLLTSSRLQAASLAWRLICPQQAQAFLGDGLLEPDGEAAQDETSFALLCLQADLAFETGSQSAAAQVVQRVQQIAPAHAHSLLLQARLAALSGEEEPVAALWQAACAALQENEADLSSLRAASQTAADLADWGQSVFWAQRAAEQAPDDLLSCFYLAQSLVRRAEAQELCRRLEIRHHSPGETALGEMAGADFEKLMLDLQAGVDRAAGGQFSTHGECSWSYEACQWIARWQRRGRAIFTPGAGSAQDYEQALHTFAIAPDELAALIGAWQSAGQPEAAIKLAQSELVRTTTGSLGLLQHPLVLTRLALALEDINPSRALDIAGRVLAGRATFILWPSYPMRCFLFGSLALRVGEQAAALQALEEALHSWPDEPRWHALAASLQMESGNENWSQAVTHLENACRLETENATHHLALGRLYLQKGESARALPLLERACQLEAQQAEHWLLLAQAQQAQGELELAAASAERAAHLAADPTAALLLRGEIALLLNRPRSALHHAQAVLRRNVQQPAALYLLSRALAALNHPQEALEALEKALPHLDGGLAVQIERACLLRQTQGLEMALAALQALSATYPAHPLLYTLLAEWLVEAGREDDALQTARLALQADHDELPARRRADLHYLLGVQMRRLGQLDQSVHHLNESIQRHPQHMETYLELGRTHQERREYKQALCIYQQAIEMAQEDYRPYYQAAMALKEGKDYLEAESMLRRAAQLAPEDVNVHRLLGAVVALNLVHNRRIVTGGLA